MVSAAAYTRVVIRSTTSVVFCLPAGNCGRLVVAALSPQPEGQSFFGTIQESVTSVESRFHVAPGVASQQALGAVRR
jgi:hypothetical protein